MLKWMSCKHAAHLATLALIAVGSVHGAEATKPATLVGKPAKTFSTAGHPKAKGVELTISYPADWNSEETGGSMGVQTFVNPTSTAMVMVVTRAGKRALTTDEAAKMLADRASIAKLFPSDANIEAFETTKLGEEPAAYVETTHSREQAGKKAYSRSLFLVFFQGDTAVMIHGMVASQDIAAMEKTFESHRELFKQILGSVVLAKAPK